MLFGPRSRRVFRLGDALQVRVARVDLDRRQVELVIDDLDALPRRARPVREAKGGGAARPARQASSRRPGRRERIGKKKGRR